MAQNVRFLHAAQPNLYSRDRAGRGNDVASHYDIIDADRNMGSSKMSHVRNRHILAEGDPASAAGLTPTAVYSDNIN